MKRDFLQLRLALVCFVAMLACCGVSHTEAPKEEADTAVRISPEGVNAAEPAIAAGAWGDLFVAYVEHNDRSGDLYVQKLDSNGRTEGERVRVNPKPGEAKAWKGDPPAIGLGKDGTIYVGWTRALPDPNARGNDLVLSTSKDGGRTFSEPVKINDDEKPASHGMHSLAVDANGHVFAAWLDERNIKVEDHAKKAAGAAVPNLTATSSIRSHVAAGNRFSQIRRSRPRSAHAAKPLYLLPRTELYM